MHKFSTLLIMVLLASAAGCRSTGHDTKIFAPWGWEDAEDAKSHLDRYKHILVARVYESNWEDRGPHRLTPYHFKATVVRSCKGDWKVSERVAFVHYVDAPAPTNASGAPRDDLVFLFTNEHTDAEIALDTGDFGTYNAEHAPALECLYPQRSRP